MSMVKTVILAGGQGTRLREETEYRPKPMVEIGGYPIIWHILKLYAHHGHRDFVICLGYRGSMIKEYFLNYEAMTTDFTVCLGRLHQVAYHGAHGEQDYRVTLADTGLNSMTGGRVRRIQKYIDNETFLVTYGDGVSNVDIGALLKYHHSHGRLATVTTVRPTSRFGNLQIGDDGHVLSFAEKPKLDSWVNAGYFVFNRRVFDYLDGDECVLEQQPLERLTHEGELMAYRHDGFFFAMDTYREYVYLNELWSSGQAPWRVWE